MKNYATRQQQQTGHDTPSAGLFVCMARRRTSQVTP